MNLWNPDFWAILASLSTIISAGVIIYAAIVAVGQLREMTRARQLEATREIFAHLETPEARELRKFVYELTGKPEDLSEYYQGKVLSVIATLDNVGFLVNLGLMPKDTMLPFYYDIFLKCWKKLKPYVEYQRDKRGLKKYAANLENVAKLSEEYRKQHYPGQEIRVFQEFKMRRFESWIRK